MTLAVRLALMLSWLAVTAPSFGQAQQAADVQARVTFGIDNTIDVDRWTPVTVHVSSGDEAFGGRVNISYPIDERNTLTYTTAFATTPGRETAVNVYVRLPLYCPSLTVSISRDGAARPAWRQGYEQGPGRGDLPMPAQIQRAQRGFLSVGDTGLPRAHRVWKDQAVLNDDTQDTQDEAFDSTQFGRPRDLDDPDDLAEVLSEMGARTCQPGALPQSWIGYDSFSTLFVRATDAQAASAALPAIREWTARGGLLVVIADSAGDDWKQWLDERGSAGIALGPVARHPVPDTCARLVGEAAADVQARLITREPGSRWSVRWALGDGTPETGMLAERTVGFGRVILLGVTPRRLSSVLDDKAEAAVILSVIRAPLNPALTRAAADQSRSYGYSDQSGASAAINRVSQDATFDDSFFPVVLGASLLLALLIGPVDAIVLRRLHLTHRSWVSALLWIGVAGALAYVVPTQIRAGPTTVRQFQIADYADGRWCSVTCHGIFTGSSRRATYQGVPGDSWWRPVTASGPFYDGSSSALAQGHVIAQGSTAGGGVGGAPLTGRMHRTWTFSSFVSESAEPAPMEPISFDRTSDGRLRLVVRFAGTAEPEALLHEPEGWRVASEVVMNDDTCEFVFSEREMTDSPTSWELGSTQHSPWSESYSLGNLLRLGDASARTDAAESLVDIDGLACVYITFEGQAATLSMDEVSVGGRDGVVRLLLPMPEETSR